MIISVVKNAFLNSNVHGTLMHACTCKVNPLSIKHAETGMTCCTSGTAMVNIGIGLHITF